MTRLFAVICWLSIIGSAMAQQPPLMPDQPEAPRVDDFKCIEHADTVMTKFGLAVASQEEFEVMLFSGEKAKSILKTINEDPPPTHYKADSLFAVLHHASEGAGEEDKGAVMLFLISDECIVGNVPKIPMSAWKNIISRAIGDDT